MQIIKYKTLPLGLDHCRINDLYISFVGSHDGASQHIISYCDSLNVHNYIKSGTVQGKTFEEKTSQLERKMIIHGKTFMIACLYTCIAS